MNGWTEDLIDQLIYLYNKGRSFQEISNALGVVTRSACIGKLNRLRASGDSRVSKRKTPSAPGKKHKPNRKECQKDQVSLYILQRYEFDGAMPKDIAFELGISPQTVRRQYTKIINALVESEAA